jgi:cytochrome b pre-mRNA-processing protein 3
VPLSTIGHPALPLPASLIFTLLRTDPIRQAALAAYRCIVAQARQPGFFTDCGVPDTVDGRFELICLHAFLYLHRVKRDRPRSTPLGQRFFDEMFSDFDRSLREMGTGDLSVGREIRRMAEAFYGRVAAYETGLADGDARLATALARNLFGTAAPTACHLTAMAAYVRREAARLGGQKSNELLAGSIVFGDVPTARAAGAA